MTITQPSRTIRINPPTATARCRGLSRWKSDWFGSAASNHASQASPPRYKFAAQASGFRRLRFTRLPFVLGGDNNVALGN